MDWSKLPDLLAVALLSCAFAAVAKRSQSPVSGIWLTGWVMIVLHFAAFIAAPLDAPWGLMATFIGFASLAWAGLLFTWASVPYRQESTNAWMLAILLAANTLYIGIIVMIPDAMWALVPAAILFGAVPLALTLIALPRFNHPLRWTLVALYSALSIFLLVFQHHPGNGADLALNAVFFTVFFTCCLHFWHAYRNPSAGAFITIAGFFAWASVFVVAPCIGFLWPQARVEREVWNLPKYIVAVGMILLQLEEQLEHNRHLALHDELTGLPNRRLFQDRLASALERARRSGSQTALLLIDLNEFKQVNDTVGHHIGDLLLKRVGNVFSGRVRRSDTVARTGGDEFSIILEEPTTREEAEKVGESLIRLLEKPFELEGHSVRVGASVGIAIFPNDAPAAESLRIAADLRMYKAKNTSRKMDLEEASPKSGSPKLQSIKPRRGLQLMD